MTIDLSPKEDRFYDAQESFDLFFGTSTPDEKIKTLITTLKERCCEEPEVLSLIQDLFDKATLTRFTLDSDGNYCLEMDKPLKASCKWFVSGCIPKTLKAQIQQNKIVFSKDQAPPSLTVTKFFNPNKTYSVREVSWKSIPEPHIDAVVSRPKEGSIQDCTKSGSVVDLKQKITKISFQPM